MAGRGRRSFWLRSRLSPVAPRIVNGVSYVRRIKPETHFSWQAQYLVMLRRHFFWQYLVTLDCDACGSRNVNDI